MARTPYNVVFNAFEETKQNLPLLFTVSSQPRHFEPHRAAGSSRQLSAGRFFFILIGFSLRSGCQRSSLTEVLTQHGIDAEKVRRRRPAAWRYDVTSLPLDSRMIFIPQLKLCSRMGHWVLVLSVCQITRSHPISTSNGKCWVNHCPELLAGRYHLNSYPRNYCPVFGLDLLIPLWYPGLNVLFNLPLVSVWRQLCNERSHQCKKFLARIFLKGLSATQSTSAAGWMQWWFRPL